MIDDKELIRKFTSGDEKAFDQIVQNNLNNVFGFFMKITRDEMAAEDLTQDVFLKLYKNLKNFRHESNFSTYLYRINSNTANKMTIDGTISGGMIPKIKTSIDAVNNGVTGVAIVDARTPHACLFEIFTDKGAGTLIRK